MWVHILREIPFLNITPEVGFAGGEISFLNITPEVGFAILFLNITPELGFAGEVTTPWYCCIPSKRVVNAASCVCMLDISVLLLVAELAMLFSAIVMGATAKGELVSWERWA